MPQKLYDYLILGAGPAGLQLGYHLKQAGRDYLVLEAGDRPGAFFEKFPRHDKLISINKIYTGYEDPEVNLRFDWNSLLSDDPELVFKNYSREYFPQARDLQRYLQDYAERTGVRVRYRTRIEDISRPEHFELTDTEGNVFSGRRLIVATGLSKPYVPDVPGIELGENYVDMPVDAEEFAGQSVLILGKGNSAFETADHLIPTTSWIHVVSPEPLELAWKSHFVGHLRAVNNNFLDTYQLKSQNAVLDGTVKSITRREDGKLEVHVSYTHADEEHEHLIYDRVLVCTGFRMDTSIFDPSCAPQMTIKGRFPDLTSEWESVDVPDLYVAGTLTQVRDFKKATSGFIHGFRYNVRVLHRMLERKYHGVDWPSERLDSTPEEFCQSLLERINRTSAMWQQFGFLGDLYVRSENGKEMIHYEELPLDFIQDSEFGRADDYYVVDLEFGKVCGDPFNIQRHPDPSRAEDSVFLHPVIRHYHRGEKVAELHLLENLLGEWWDDEQHRAPLLKFLRDETSVAGRLSHATGDTLRGLATGPDSVNEAGRV